MPMMAIGAVRPAGDGVGMLMLGWEGESLSKDYFDSSTLSMIYWDSKT